MELHTGDLYWESTVQHKGFAKKETEKVYDAIVIGGGMSGALCSYVLSKEGYSLCLIEEAKAGGGSTAANTGLLQFSNDIMLHELMDQIGEKEAVDFYKSCKKALDQLQEAARNMPIDVQFHSRSSLYYASTEEDVPRLRKEYKALKKYGFPVEYWERKDIEAHFPFSKPAAIITEGDAEVNPLQLCLGAVQFATEKGMDVFEHTAVTELFGHGDVAEVKTAAGNFYGRSVIVTTGYTPTLEAEIPEKELKVTYAAATEPIADLSFWNDRMMIWETKRPYLYMRLTDDQRIVAGGLDEDTGRIPDDEKNAEKFMQLKNELEKLFPQQAIRFEYEWTAIFGESADELPVVSRHPHEPNIYYLIGLGGNGTVYSMLGAYLIRDELEGNRNPNEMILKIER